MLVVAHPGHELRIYHWVERHRPVVCVLTDGSRASRGSRLGSTARLLERVGAEPGPIFGRLSDREIYSALMEGDVERFVALAREIEALIAERRIGIVVGDASEGYNPAHDVCRSLIDAACRRAGRPIENLAFLLAGDPQDVPRRGEDDGHLRLRLDDLALARKLDAAQRYGELEDEVNASLTSFGQEAFRDEVLFAAGSQEPIEGQPHYEIFGEIRVSEGAYSRVLRYREHVLPVERALDAYARGVD
jgi:hypothetical protein